MNAGLCKRAPHHVAHGNSLRQKKRSASAEDTSGKRRGSCQRPTSSLPESTLPVVQTCALEETQNSLTISAYSFHFRGKPWRPRQLPPAAGQRGTSPNCSCGMNCCPTIRSEMRQRSHQQSLQIGERTRTRSTVPRKQQEIQPKRSESVPKNGKPPA